MASGGRGIFSALFSLPEELERMISDTVGAGGRGGPSRRWAPLADVFVRKGAVVVRFEIPGVRREDIDLTYQDGELRVRGSRLECEEEPKEGYWQMEISHGPFERSVKIPLPVDPDRIEAQFREGILEVRMPVTSTRRVPSEVKVKCDA